VAVEADGSLHIRDLGSTNGITINGQKVELGRISPGDEVLLGNAVWLACEKNGNTWHIDLSDEATRAREVQPPPLPPPPAASVVIPEGAIIQVRVTLPAGSEISPDLKLPPGMELIIGEPEPPPALVKGTDEQAARPDLEAPGAEESHGPGVSQHRTISELRRADDDQPAVEPSNPPAAAPAKPEQDA
jgi:hypothetical protein